MSITKEEVAEVVRGYMAAYDNHDIQTIVAMGAREVGFGYRMIGWRDWAALGKRTRFAENEQVFGQMDYYHLNLEDLQTSVAGDIGLAWGVFIEDFQVKGRPPERARVRFSNALSKGARGWQSLLFHRDIQPFDEEGCYPTELTVNSSTT